MLLTLIIGRLLNHAPIPTAQNTVPARKPLRVFSFWKLELAAPRHLRRAIAQILMQPNVVVEIHELADRLFKASLAVDFDLSNCPFESAEKAFDAAIGPRAVRRATLMFDPQAPHCQREVARHQSAVIIAAQRFRLSERFNQPIQHSQNRIRASVREIQCQQSAAAMINHAQQCVGFATNRNVRPIQGPSLICFSRSWMAGAFACGRICMRWSSG